MTPCWRKRQLFPATLSETGWIPLLPAAAAAGRLRLHTSFSAGPGPNHSIMNMKCLLIDVYGKSEWLKILDGAIGHGLDLIKFCFTSKKKRRGGRGNK